MIAVAEPKKIVAGLAARVSQQKEQAAESRSTPKPADVAGPRDLYLKSCAKIAQSFEPEFRYAKSKQICTSEGSDLRYTIGFQSSHKNVAGKYVALWVYAGISSHKLKAFRDAHACSNYGSGGNLAGGQIGNLTPKGHWCDWNLAVGDLDTIIQDVVATIQTVVLPYFKMFGDVDALAAKLRNTEVPSLRVENAIEFLLAHDRRLDALEHGKWFLKQNPDQISRYGQFLAAYKKNGLPEKPDSTAYSAGLAKIAIVHGLKFD